ncbi:MAG: hemolysin III family protein [Bacteroidales bacterium]|jgi:hemolysin III|nr:hemolysin III family protein [Bacteroidales bacterium]
MNVNKRFTKNEELANAISHLVGALLGVAFLVLMVVFSVKNGNAWHIVSSAVFGFTLIVLYLSSTFNHWLPVGKAKEFFFNFDQVAIYLLIAGTYTPIALVALHGAFGWTIFGIEWGLALTGIIFKVFFPGKFNKGVNIFYLISYIIMGWMFVFAFPSLFKIITFDGILWVLIGGVFYTLGTIFFKLRKLKFHHLIWHLFVLAGSIAHFVAIYFYILPIKV